MTTLTCMCPCVSLEIECVIEPFATYRTKVPLDFTMTFQMTIKQPLQWERLVADVAGKVLAVNSCRRVKANSTQKDMKVFIGYVLHL